MADPHKDRMAARKARVAAAKGETSRGESPASKPDQEPVTDYWKLPKSGARTTLINSAWTWSALVYAIILLVVLATISQQDLNLFDRGWIGTVILISLLYPAWRIGSLVSRFLKRRGIGTAFNLPGTSAAEGEESDPASVKARMEARRARVEKARQDGKL